MNTGAPNLNVIDALKVSIPFCFEFPQKHWIISALLAAVFFSTSLCSYWMMSSIKSEHSFSTHSDLLSTLGAMFDIRFVAPYILLTILGIVVGFFVTYYGIKHSVRQLSGTSISTSKSLLRTAWQLFCMNLAIGIVAIPLYLLLIIPAIWWLTKTSVATANLISTDDGPIESIKKSFQLTKGDFWRCFGYLAGVYLLPAIIFALAVGILGLCVTLPAIFIWHVSPEEDWRIFVIRSLLNTASSFFQLLILYFCQGWLYIYLKTHNKPQTT